MWGKYWVETLPQPITATLIFRPSGANLSAEAAKGESSEARLAAAVAFKNCFLFMVVVEW